jgi:hypothetical protein
LEIWEGKEVATRLMTFWRTKRGTGNIRPKLDQHILKGAATEREPADDCARVLIVVHEPCETTGAARVGPRSPYMRLIHPALASFKTLSPKVSDQQRYALRRGEARGHASPDPTPPPPQPQPPSSFSLAPPKHAQLLMLTKERLTHAAMTRRPYTKPCAA